MSATKKPTVVKAKPPQPEAPDVPQFFRLNVEVGDLDAATSFYTKLLGVQGRKHPGIDAISSVARYPASADVSLKASRTRRQRLCTLP